jgi:hypothetical protein
MIFAIAPTARNINNATTTAAERAIFVAGFIA